MRVTDERAKADSEPGAYLSPKKADRLIDDLLADRADFITELARKTKALEELKSQTGCSGYCCPPKHAPACRLDIWRIVDEALAPPETSEEVTP